VAEQFEADRVLRELPEVAYQLERPFILDSSAAQETFGLAPTPWRQVLAETVECYASVRPATDTPESRKKLPHAKTL
jgi:hypothetical protein